jgi:hypothetical protein
MEWLVEHGYALDLPVGHSPHCDLIAETEEGLLSRVQVKTSTPYKKSRWQVAVCTKGGNQSWSGTVKLLDPERIDYLFVLVGDGRRWFIPAHAIAGGTGILLGGPKYADFEVDPGTPLPA